MNKLVTFVFLSLFSMNAFATVDGNTNVYIVAQNVNTEEFYLEKVPVLGCYGIAQGPQLAQFVAEYKVTTNVGCGGNLAQDMNINLLTCAKVLDSKESSDYMGFSEITLDISNCDYKNDAKFITMIRTAAKKNFPQTNKKKEVKLKIIK